MTAAASRSGSAGLWGPRWGSRAEDWASSEDMQVPTYAEAIRCVGIEPGQNVLDIGCGSGVFLRLAADRGARVSGLDASEELVELARKRVPEADVRVGEMEALPYDDESFDLVTGFNSFFFAADLAKALREAGRVARPGAPVVIQVWGSPERCDLEAMKVVARRYFPAPPPDAPPPPRLWQRGVLEGVASDAGLTPETSFDLSYAFEYPDAETLGRLMLAPAGIGAAAGPEHEHELRAEIVEALAPYGTSGGGYHLHNEYRYLVARA